MDLEIKPVIIERPKGVAFEKLKIGNVTGKSADYLKQITIPVLQQRNSRLKQSLKESKDTIKRLRKEKAELASTIKNAKWADQKKDYAVSQKELNSRAREWFYDKMKVWRLQSSTLLDGITAYPVIQQWARQENVPYAHLCLFILANHFNSFYLKDGEVFGFNYGTTRKHLKDLVEWGWIDKYRIGRRNDYLVTLKGAGKFKEIQQFYKEQTVILLTAHDKLHNRRSGGTTVQFKGKKLYNIKNIYGKNGNK